jgi:putative membrane protein
LLLSLSNVPKPLQQEIKHPEIDKKQSFSSVAVGTMVGALMGFLPGVGSAQGTILANMTRKEVDRENTIITLAAVNASATFFSVITLFLFMRTRSGAMVAINALATIQLWDAFLPSSLLIYLLIAVLLATMLSFSLALFAGKKFAITFSRIPYRKVTVTIIAFIIMLVAVMTGFLGIFILIVATAIGLLAPSFGVRRSHAMGVLLLPVIIYLL